MLAITLEHNNPEPLYEQLKNQLIRQIEDGHLAPGDRLPATRDLAEQLGVARISVVAAYDELKANGYIEARIGRGTFVAEPEITPVEHDTGVLAGTSRPQGAALRELLRLAGRPGVIDFGQGTPPDSFLPVDIIRESINTVLTRDGGAAISYEVPEGFPPLREAIAASFNRRGIEISAGEVLITGGCQQALDLAIQALLTPGDVLLTSNPTYPGILDIAQARGVIAVGVPVDDEGLQVDQLETLIIEHRPRLIYIAPTYHNPTGTVMPLNRRRTLLTLAERYRVPVLEDGVYEELNTVGTPPPPLKALDTANLVLYASSFSKVLLPGMRIGYLLASGRLYRRLARVKAAADICTPALNQRAIHLALESGQIDDHLVHVRAACRSRRTAMLTAMTRHWPEAGWIEPTGGLYLWVKLPEDGPTATELYLNAVRNDVAFAIGPLFYTNERGSHHLRLNMVAHPPDVIEQGITRLASTWKDLAAGYEYPEQDFSGPFL